MCGSPLLVSNVPTCPKDVVVWHIRVTHQFLTYCFQFFIYTNRSHQHTYTRTHLFANEIFHSFVMLGWESEFAILVEPPINEILRVVFLRSGGGQQQRGAIFLCPVPGVFWSGWIAESTSSRCFVYYPNFVRLMKADFLTTPLANRRSIPYLLYMSTWRRISQHLLIPNQCWAPLRDMAVLSLQKISFLWLLVSISKIDTST